jgi:hypothetical protein
MDRVTNILSSIPGYDGYRDKENRRETDRRVRDRISDRLGQLAGQIEQVAADLANRRDIQAVGPVDSVAKAVRHLQNQIATATYGYGGVYSDRNVDALALDQLNQFDADLLTKVETLAEPIVKLAGAGDPSARGAAISEIQTALAAVQQRFDERAYVVETGRPAAQASATSPLTVLEQDSTKPLKPAALGLQQGYALAFGGENFIVDAVIDVEGQQPMRLFRIDVAPERWLLANERFGAVLSPADFTESGDTVVIDGQTLSLHGSGTSPSRVTGLGGRSGQQSVMYRVYGGASENGPLALTLTWPSATLRLVGGGISLEDIEVFGKPDVR